MAVDCEWETLGRGLSDTERRAVAKLIQCLRAPCEESLLPNSNLTRRHSPASFEPGS